MLLQNFGRVGLSHANPQAKGKVSMSIRYQVGRDGFSTLQASPLVPITGKGSGHHHHHQHHHRTFLVERAP